MKKLSKYLKADKDLKILEILKENNKTFNDMRQDYFKVGEGFIGLVDDMVDLLRKYPNSTELKKELKDVKLAESKWRKCFKTINF